MTDIELLSKTIDRPQQTCRVLLQRGMFGKAVKGSGSHYIYFVDWDEVEKWRKSERQKENYR